MIKHRNRTIARRYDNGESSHVLASVFNISSTQVLRIVRSHGVKVRNAIESIKARYRLPAEQVEVIVKMYKTGKRDGGLNMRLCDIANRFDCSITKIRRVLLANKVKMRSGLRRKKRKDRY